MLVRDYRLRSGITAESGFTCYQTTDKAPDGSFWIENVCTDQSTSGAGSGMPNERSDGQIGGVPLGSYRCNVWYEMFLEIPSVILDRWMVVGPCEIHGQRLDQATLMPEVSPQKRRRLNANAGRSSTRYFDMGEIKIGTVYSNRLIVIYRNDNQGYLRWERTDGVSTWVKEIKGEPTTVESASGYWKCANYRNAQINGTSRYRFAGGQIHDVEVPMLPLSGQPPVEQPPIDTKPPVVTLTNPIGGVSYPLDAIPFSADAQDEAGIKDAWFGVVCFNADGSKHEASQHLTQPGPYVASLNLKAQGGQAGIGYCYVKAVDKNGNETTRSVNVNLTEPTVPPPPPPAEADFADDVSVKANRIKGNATTLLPRATSDDSKRRLKSIQSDAAYLIEQAALQPEQE